MWWKKIHSVAERHSCLNQSSNHLSTVTNGTAQHHAENHSKYLGEKKKKVIKLNAHIKSKPS